MIYIEILMQKLKVKQMKIIKIEKFKFKSNHIPYSKDITLDFSHNLPSHLFHNNLPSQFSCYSRHQGLCGSTCAKQAVSQRVIQVLNCTDWYELWGPAALPWICGSKLSTSKWIAREQNLSQSTHLTTTQSDYFRTLT